MAGFVGIDLGSHLIKGAVARDENPQVQILRLDPAGRSAGLPFVVRQGMEIGAGWDQYSQRRADAAVAFAFRDRVWEASSSFSLGGRTVQATDMLAPVCAGIRNAVSAAAPGAAAVGISSPDPWPRGSDWTLPQALAVCGWNPAILVRESVAVLADWLHRTRRKAVRRVVLLSLGAGSTWASLMAQKDSGDWQLQDAASDEGLSGRTLRELLIAEFAREVVTRERRDPTESAADDQSLHDALESGLHQLATQRECELRAILFGNPITLSLSAVRLADLARPLGERFESVMADWRARFARTGLIDAVLYWGDLASKMSLGATVARAFPSAETHALDPYCVARGVARLVALVHSGRLSRESANRCGAVPLFESLPACNAIQPNGIQLRARVVRLDGGQGHALAIGDTLRFGRASNADCVIEPHLTQVSGAHAVILRKGSIYVLTDLHSTNGTYVNGKLLTGPAPLSHGDTITLAVDGPSFRFEEW